MDDRFERSGLPTVVRVEPMDGWPMPTKGERRRDELLRAGVDLLLEQGWSSLTARGVAERAGLTPSLVGYHFGSQWRLKSQVVDVVLDEVFSPFLDEVVRHPTWQLGLAAVLRGHDQDLEGRAGEVDHLGHDSHDSHDLVLDDFDDLAGYARVEVNRRRVLADLVAASLQDAVIRDQLRAALGDVRERLVPWLRDTGVPVQHVGATATVVVAVLDGLLLHSVIDDHLRVASVADVLERLGGPAATVSPPT